MVRLILLFLFFTANNLLAQDLIVKRSGEVIYCQIELVEDYYIHFYEIQDSSKQLLYKMDAVLVEKIVFNSDGQLPLISSRTKRKNESYSESYLLIETNLDGIFNDFFSLHIQYIKPKYTIDFGIKRYRSADNIFFQSIEDSGSMFEMGMSFPLKIFGTEEKPLKGLYLRGFGIYTAGDFTDIFQTVRSVEYNQLSFGIQGVLNYQLTTRFNLKAYYGLGGTIQVGSFGPPVRRADLSGSDGLQSIYGVRVGYIF